MASLRRRIAAFGLDYLAMLLYIGLLVLLPTGTGAAAAEGWIWRGGRWWRPSD